MIRWCSYCSTYLGESPPYEDYSLTHGICPKCNDKFFNKKNPDKQKIDDKTISLVNFYKKLKSSISKSQFLLPAHILEEATLLGIKPIDLLFGMIQPVLYEVGNKWSKSELSVAEEHTFTATCNSVIELAWSLYSDKINFRNSTNPTVLATNIDGNIHIVGLRMLEVLLTAEQIPNFCVYPGIPNEEIFNLVKKLKPKILGLSISLETQIPLVEKLSKLIETLPLDQRPSLILGGFPIRMGYKPDPNLKIDTFIDSKAFLERVLA